MFTSFEFLPRTRRRIAPPWILLGTFLGIGFVALAFFFALRESVQDLQSRYEREAGAIEARRQELISQAWKLIPESESLTGLKQDIDRHNFTLIGPRTPWNDILRALEEELPTEAVIAKIENPRTNTQVFPAGENDFKLTVVVADGETANIFYRKISARKAFQSLSFTPKGETTHHGRKGIAIEIVFHFEASS